MIACAGCAELKRGLLDRAWDLDRRLTQVEADEEALRDHTERIHASDVALGAIEEAERELSRTHWLGVGLRIRWGGCGPSHPRRGILPRRLRGMVTRLLPSLGSPRLTASRPRRGRQQREPESTDRGWTSRSASPQRQASPVFAVRADSCGGEQQSPVPLTSRRLPATASCV